MSFESRSPATNQVLRTYEPHDDETVRRRIGIAHERFAAWRRVSFRERAARMADVARLLRDRNAELARLMAEEMGKPLSQGRSETEKCAWVCEYYAEHAEAFLAPESIVSDARWSGVHFRPLGVVLAVMPWNFPLWQVFRFAAPALMAGNAGLLKHASNVPACADAIEEVFADAGFPQGLFANLRIESKRVAGVIEHEHVRAVTLTGSTPAGRAVAAKAGEQLKKCVLELGGSDPYVVLDDADLDQAAEICVTGRMVNSGQSCIAAKRWIVVESVREAFTERVVARMRAQKLGDPLDEATDVGPMARTDLRDELHDQVTRSLEAGAALELGGEVPSRAGAWYPPTVLTDVRPGMPAYAEELFGPVGVVIAADSEADALRMANDSVFGLGAAVITGDPERGKSIAAEELEAGCCFVNAFVRSDPRLPFGGVKESGYGRELGSFGIREFVNVKTVYVA